MTLANAPLVEIIAELRWEPQSTALTLQQGGISTFQPHLTHIDFSSLEPVFTKFAGLAHNLGFSQMERLLPMGFPIVAFQPIYRFRDFSTTSANLYQIGAGVFTTNALPPYGSWDNFAPNITKGVDALLASRSEQEKDLPFTSISLRYIDAFGPPLTEGRNIATFLKEVFQLEIILPFAMKNNIVDGGVITPTVQLQIPMATGLVMNLVIGEGMANNEVAIIFDTTVISTTPTAPTTYAIMDTLHIAHTVIHEMFYELVKPISHLMQLSEGN